MDNIKIISLAEYGASMGTREFGQQIREKSIALVRNGHRILFDFSKISMISSAFADELFGKLFVELGEEVFKSSIKINKFDNEDIKSLIILIITKAIEFRKKKYELNQK